MKRSHLLLNRALRPIRLGERGELRGFPVHEPVEVFQDRWGIPHIFARSDRDLVAAQGFLHARDRLWQMESVRRMASGTLAEIAGERLIGSDCFCRLVGLDLLRRRAVEAATEQARDWLEAYVSGVNAYIEAAGRSLPLEFRTLGVTPAPWRVEDLAGSLAINAWFLQTNYQEEVLALSMRDRLTLGQWDELFPGWPGSRLPDDDFFRRSRGLRIGAVIPEALAWYPSLAPVAAPAPGAPSPAPGPAEAVAVQPPPGETLPGSSNNWAVARGEGGAPLLANDPHLGVTVPQVWYLCHLHSPQLNVCGASLPGNPGIVLGRNEHLAWGVTNLMTDCVDLFVLKIDPDRPTRYLYRGEYREMEVESVRLAVAGGNGRTLTIRRTLHGPVITEVERGLDAVVSLKWYGTCSDPGDRDTTIPGFFALNRARNLDEGQAAVDLIATVGQNFLLADTRGHIAWRPSGRIPVRTGYSGRLPAEGSSGACDWTGFLPPERVPRRADPLEGFLATANHRMAPEGWPQPLSHTFCAPYRCRRIEQLLRLHPAPTADDFQAMQMDVRSLRAEHMLPVILGFRYDHPLAREAAAVLQGWDREVHAGSQGALIFNVFLVEASELLLRPLLGEGVRVMHSVGPYLYNALDRLFERVRQDGSAALPAGADGERRPPLLEGAAALRGLCEQALVRAMAAALRDRGSSRGRQGGPQPRWGNLHTYCFEHPGARGRLASWLLSRGRYPAGGDGTTVNVSIYNAGFGTTPLQRYETAAIPSMRLVCSLAGIDRTSIMAPMGQSGQPGHPHYDDLIRPWMHGRMVPLPLSREGAERVAVDRLVLRG